MFGSKIPITDKIKEALTEYIDEKFEEYRGEISNDLSKGIGGLAGLVAIWSMFIICLLFVSFSIALFLGWLLSFWLNLPAYIISFAFISILLITAAYLIFKNKKRYIEAPVYKIISKALNNPKYVEVEEEFSAPSQIEILQIDNDNNNAQKDTNS